MHLKLKTLEDFLRITELLEYLRRRRIRLRWSIGAVSEQRWITAAGVAVSDKRGASRESEFMVIITDSQQFRARVQVVDKRGNPAAYENAVWSSSDSSLVTVEQDAADSAAALVKAVGPLGSAQVNVQVDGIVGEGESFVTGTLDVQVVAGQATGLNISTDAAEEQP